MVVEVDNRGRILLNKRLRKKYNIKPGEKLLVIESEDGILLKSIDLSLERLSEIMKDVRWSRDARRRAEKWLIEEAKRS